MLLKDIPDWTVVERIKNNRPWGGNRFLTIRNDCLWLNGKVCSSFSRYLLDIDRYEIIIGNYHPVDYRVCWNQRIVIPESKMERVFTTFKLDGFKGFSGEKYKLYIPVNIFKSL